MPNPTQEKIDDKGQTSPEQAACPTWVGGLFSAVARALGWMKRKLLG